MPANRLTSPVMTVCSKYKSGLPRAATHCGFTWPVAISSVLQRSLTVPLHSPSGLLILTVRAVHRGCERAYSSQDSRLVLELHILSTEALSTMVEQRVLSESCNVYSNQEQTGSYFPKNYVIYLILSPLNLIKKITKMYLWLSQFFRHECLQGVISYEAENSSDIEWI